jgi:hypothetical protein
VPKNRARKIIFGLKREEITGGQGKYHREEFHNLCSSPQFTGMIKSRRMRWVGHVSHMRKMKNS